jgi:Meckel syndrome type 1 protein
MTAPAINPAPFASAAPGPGAAAATPGAAAGVFEALMAALFPPTPGSIAPTPGAIAAPSPELLGDEAPAEDAEVVTTEGEGGSDAATALAASLAGAQPATAQAPSNPAKEVADTPPAWGQGKAKGAPAQPALRHADPHANLSAKAADAPEGAADSPEPASDASDAPSANTPSLPSQAADTARAAVQAAPARQSASAPPPAPTPVADGPDAALPAPPAASTPEGEAAAAPQPAVSDPDGASTVLASTATARPEAAPAQPARPGRAEKTRGVTEDPGSADPRPTDAAGKPVLTKAVDPAARTPSAKPDTVETPAYAEAPLDAEAPDTVQSAEARAADQSSAPAAQTAQPVRGSPETVAALAAQIIKKLDGKSTRFDVELDPAGLGKVDVRVEIGAHGRMVASLTFENPQAAQDLKARSGELQRALEQAGFDLSGGLSFDVAGDRGRQGQAWQETPQQGSAFQGRAFRQALDTAGEAESAATQGALRLRRGVSAGLDLRI